MSKTSKKIDIIKEEINPFIEIKSRLKIKTPYAIAERKLEDLKKISERIPIDFIVENSCENEVESNDSLEAFRVELREMLKICNKFYFIENKNKPILLLFGSHLTLNDKVILIAESNKDLDELIDIIVLINYPNVKIENGD